MSIRIAANNNVINFIWKDKCNIMKNVRKATEILKLIIKGFTRCMSVN